jgi:hypothetical protein
VTGFQSRRIRSGSEKGGRYSPPNFSELSGISDLSDAKELHNVLPNCLVGVPMPSDVMHASDSDRLGSLFAVLAATRPSLAFRLAASGRNLFGWSDLDA